MLLTNIGKLVMGAALLPLFLLGCSQTQETNRIYTDYGGPIVEYINNYQDMAANNERLEIYGMCASACTYFLGLIPTENVCAHEKAVFGFHGVYEDTGVQLLFNPIATQFIHEWVYPAEIRLTLALLGFDGTEDIDRNIYPSGTIWLMPEVVGVGYCEPN